MILSLLDLLLLALEKVIVLKFIQHLVLWNLTVKCLLVPMQTLLVFILFLYFMDYEVRSCHLFKIENRKMWCK